MLEIVEFYEKEKTDKKITGTLHIYLIEEEIDIRGINVLIHKGKYFFFVPLKKDVDENGQTVFYPVFHYANQNKADKFKEELKRLGVEFLENNYPDIRKFYKNDLPKTYVEGHLKKKETIYKPKTFKQKIWQTPNKKTN